MTPSFNCHRLFAALCAFLLLTATTPAASPDKDERTDPRGSRDSKDHARLTVSGLGWLDNLRMKGVLRQSRPTREAPATYDANAIEDGVFLLLNHAERLGYLRASVTAELVQEDGTRSTFTWEKADDPPLPRPFNAREVHYRINSGQRFFYGGLTFEGLTAIRVEEAQRFFVRTDGLIKSRALLRFSRSELKEAAGNLEAALRGRGYARATVVATNLVIQETNGSVRVRVQVDEGAMYRARSLHVVVRDTPEGPVLSDAVRSVDEIVSRAGLQDMEQRLLEEWFHLGYPDAVAHIVAAKEIPNGDRNVLVDLRGDVTLGTRVRLGQTRFDGRISEQTRESLQRRTELNGPWLDRIEADDARARLARLGGYRFINVRYDPVSTNPETRDVVFELEPGKRLSVDLMAGLRSYELLYGGVDVVRRNLFGIGHSAELRFIQSFKSSEGYANYSIPDAFAENVTLYALVDALQREEISFRREELLTSVGLRKALDTSHQQVGIRYNYELLRAVDAPVDVRTVPTDRDQPKVASFTVDWSWDRRDSAVTPHRGFNIGAALEFALPELGGEARYLRPELEASAHFPVGGGRFVRAGIRYQMVADPGGDGLIPFNKRIFPGGEDTVRGFQRGEAAPRNADGEIIGAESALVWNVEFEQLLTPSWSVVAFVDGVAETSDINESPLDEVLWSAGGGLRWNTAIGPVRVEYGYNLNPRRKDPVGTLQFSVGFPF